MTTKTITDWYAYERGDIREEDPLIYFWQVRTRTELAVFEYVGKSENGARRPTKDYTRNVNDLLAGKFWHGNEAKDFREVHWVLAGAHIQKYKIVLRLICNAPIAELRSREKEYQRSLIVSNSANRSEIDSLIDAAKATRARVMSLGKGSAPWKS